MTFILGQIQSLKFFFAFKKRNMLETSAVKAKLFWILRSLRRSAVDHEDIGYLIELDV